MRRWTTTTLLVLTLTVLGTGPALAHVTVTTDNDAAGGFAKYTVRVPNERDDASTVEVRIQLPESLEASRVQPLAGWTIDLSEGELVVSGGSIGPGEFQEFAFQARNPEQPTPLTFPSVQVYDSGEEVEWVGEPDSDEPAPVVEITPGGAAGADGDGAELAELRAQVEELRTSHAAPAAPEGPDALTLVALVMGALGLVSGIAALAVARRR